jgi:hypothetical protein
MSEQWLVKKADDAMGAAPMAAPVPAMPGAPTAVNNPSLVFNEPDHALVVNVEGYKDSIKLTINPGEENKNLEKIQKLVAKKNKEIEKLVKDFMKEVEEEVNDFAEDLQDEFSKE